MGIFDKIKAQIFGKRQQAPAAAPPTPTPTPTTTVSGGGTTAPAAPAATTATVVDVEVMMEALAARQSHPVNWRHSIVDLMSLLGIDNSLADRRELARELGYTGSLEDTATMNVWLHKQVMRKLAENGGKVPADLLD